MPFLSSYILHSQILILAIIQQAAAYHDSLASSFSLMVFLVITKKKKMSIAHLCYSEQLPIFFSFYLFSFILINTKAFCLIASIIRKHGIQIRTRITIVWNPSCQIIYVIIELSSSTTTPDSANSSIANSNSAIAFSGLYQPS